MNRKDEYINQLERALVGHIDPDRLRDIMNYYHDYISIEITKGRDEMQVIDELGSPQLLAKSILAAEGAGSSRDAVITQDEQDNGEKKNYNIFSIPWPLLLVIVVMIIFGVIGLIFSIASVLLPILFPIICFYCVIKAIQNIRKR